MDNPAFQRKLAWQLLARLERLSADSPWAHQASGVRGALLRCLQSEGANLQECGAPVGLDSLQALMERGFYILENAAREMERRL